MQKETGLGTVSDRSGNSYFSYNSLSVVQNIESDDRKESWVQCKSIEKCLALRQALCIVVLFIA